MGREKLISCCETRPEAEADIKRLVEAGLNPAQLAIVSHGHDTHEHLTGFYSHSDIISSWTLTGLFFGWLFGLWFSPPFIYRALLEGLRPLWEGLNMGPMLSWNYVGSSVTWFTGAVLCSMLGACIAAISAYIYTGRSARTDLLKYETVRDPQLYAVVMEGSGEEAAKARSIAKRQHAA